MAKQIEIFNNDGAAWRLSPLLPLELNQDRQSSLVAILAIAHDKEIPLPPLLRAFATEHRFWFRYALFRVADCIEAGDALPTALMRYPGLLSHGTVLALLSANSNDAIALSYATLLEVSEQRKNTKSMRVIGSILYWGVITLPALLVVIAITAFIPPTYRRMFQELDLTLSPLVNWIFSVMSSATLSFVIALQMIGLFLFLYWFSPLKRIIRRLLFRWDLSLSRRRDRTDLLTGTAIAIRCGANLDRHCRNIQSFCENRSFRRYATVILQYVAKGTSPWLALGHVGLVSSHEATALNEMPNDSMRAWALLRMTQRDIDVSRMRRNTLFTVLHPLMLFVFGIIVLGICYATFQPLTSLLHALS